MNPIHFYSHRFREVRIVIQVYNCHHCSHKWSPDNPCDILSPTYGTILLTKQNIRRVSPDSSECMFLNHLELSICKNGVKQKKCCRKHCQSVPHRITLLMLEHTNNNNHKGTTHNEEDHHLLSSSSY